MKNATLIVTLLDRSGSMRKIQNDMQGGFDTFIAEQRKCNSDECSVSLYQFDDRYEAVYENLPLSKVPNLNLVPRGWTALLDALGKTINTVGENLSKLQEKDRPARVVFVIITDGEENRSKEFSRQQIAEMIKLQSETYSWKFVYLGANQESFLVASALNIPRSTVMDFADNILGTKAMYGSLSSNMKSYRGGNVDGLSFSNEDRQAQQKAGVK